MWRSSNEWEKELGLELRRQRLALNMSQAEAADRADLALGTLARLERGDGSSLSSFIKYATLLGKGDWLNSFAPQVKVSPMQQFELGHQRMRAAKKEARK